MYVKSCLDTVLRMEFEYHVGCGREASTKRACKVLALHNQHIHVQVVGWEMSRMLKVVNVR